MAPIQIVLSAQTFECGYSLSMQCIGARAQCTYLWISLLFLFWLKICLFNHFPPHIHAVEFVRVSVYGVHDEWTAVCRMRFYDLGSMQTVRYVSNCHHNWVSIMAFDGKRGRSCISLLVKFTNTQFTNTKKTLHNTYTDIYLCCIRFHKVELSIIIHSNEGGQVSCYPLKSSAWECVSIIDKKKLISLHISLYNMRARMDVSLSFCNATTSFTEALLLNLLMFVQ